MLLNCCLYQVSFLQSHHGHDDTFSFLLLLFGTKIRDVVNQKFTELLKHIYLLGKLKRCVQAIQ